jgi:mono/diheme cytochrome c family protein
MRRTIIAMGAAMAMLLLQGAAHADDGEKPNLKDPSVISAGHHLYLEKHCSHCHGADGNGGVNLTRRDLADPDYVFRAIAEGRERGSLRMPAWREVLTDEEIWQAAAYVISISRKAD